ncbi:YncE family protein [Clostridium acidisoli]|nr:hypothetical protein [Clostridium acidisoli]
MDKGLILAMDCDGKIKKQYDIPNSGNIQLDLEQKKIYVCDVDKIYICNLENGKIAGTMSGFMAISCIKLDKIKKRLFVLDLLCKELSIYDVTSLNLISRHLNIGLSPYCICLEDDEYVYIGNKGGNTEKYRSSIVKLNILTGENKEIYFENKGLITSIELEEKFLYAINSSLNQVEIIDRFNEKKVGKIQTNFKEIKKICFIAEKNVLLIVGRDLNNEVKISNIDTVSNTVTDNFFLPEIKCKSFDIEIIYKKTDNKNDFVNQSIHRCTEKIQDEELETCLRRIYWRIQEVNSEKIKNENQILKLKENVARLQREVELKKKQIKYQEEKTNFYIKTNENLKEKNEYLRKKLFASDKENIIIKEKLAKKR